MGSHIVPATYEEDTRKAIGRVQTSVPPTNDGIGLLLKVASPHPPPSGGGGRNPLGPRGGGLLFLTPILTPFFLGARSLSAEGPAPGAEGVLAAHRLTDVVDIGEFLDVTPGARFQRGERVLDGLSAGLFFFVFNLQVFCVVFPVIFFMHPVGGGEAGPCVWLWRHRAPAPPAVHIKGWSEVVYHLLKDPNPVGHPRALRWVFGRFIHVYSAGPGGSDDCE